jgi:hypothetical protein
VSDTADTVVAPLARFAAQVRAAGLPPNVDERAQGLVQICLTSGGRSATTAEGKQLHAIAASLDELSPGLALDGIVFGSLPNLSRSGAVAVNAGLLTAEGADASREQTAPPLLSSVFPACVAAAHLGARDGAAVLSALAVAMEIGLRLANALEESRPGAGWATGSLPGCVAAAVATVCVLGGDDKAFHQAITLGATQAAGLAHPHTSVVGAFVTGEIASHGFESGVLAMGGWDGPARPLDGSRGFFQLFTGGPAIPAIHNDLGTTWVLLGSEGVASEGQPERRRPLDALGSADFSRLMHGNRHT